MSESLNVSEGKRAIYACAGGVRTGGVRTWTGVGGWVWREIPAISDTGFSGRGEVKSAGSEMYWRTESHSAASMVGERKKEGRNVRASWAGDNVNLKEGSARVSQRRGVVGRSTHR